MNARVILAVLAVVCCAQLSAARVAANSKPTDLLVPGATDYKADLIKCPLAILTIPRTGIKVVNTYLAYVKVKGELKSALKNCGSSEECKKDAQEAYKAAFLPIGDEADGLINEFLADIVAIAVDCLSPY